MPPDKQSRKHQALSPSVDGKTDETVPSPHARPVPDKLKFAPPSATGEIGMLGSYRIVKELGKGGMGVVYLAHDTRLNRKVALKVLLPKHSADRAAKERFLREARAAAQLTHDHIVTIYEADERDGMPFIAMQYLQGYTLDDYLKTKGSPSLPQIIRIGCETALGLAAAHQLGMVHRDVKPANLWLELPYGRVKLLDFGLAKPVEGDSELTVSGAIVGTPAFMSPEQGRAQKVDHRSDLFSLGAVLYRLCTGRIPFEGKNAMAILMALGLEDPKPVQSLNPYIPPSLAALVHQLLAKNPSARPQSADEVARRLHMIGAEISQARAMSQPVAMTPYPPTTPVVYAPTPVEQNSPFADLHPAVEPQPGASPTSATAVVKPVLRQSSAKGMWIVACAACLLAVAIIAGVIISLGKKEKKAEVTEDDPKPSTIGADAERKPAEFIHALGGVLTIKVNNEERVINPSDELPAERFTVTGVNLANNQGVNESAMANLKVLRSLTSLNLSGTTVTDGNLTQLKGLRRLKELVLADTHNLTDFGLSNFSDCRGLVHLDLNNSAAATNQGLDFFSGFKDLAEVSLFKSEVTDDGLAALKDCKNLRYLGLFGCEKLKGPGLANLKDCKNLKELDARRSKISETDVAEFKKVHPECKVDYP
jgi:serine/threonine protein kinase